MKDNFSISRYQVQKILSKFGLGLLVKAEEIKTGSINPVFVINDQYILRVNTKTDPQSKQKFEKESFLYNVLATTSIPTPDCLAFDTSHEIVKYDYLVLSYIPGETLTVAFDKADTATKSRLSFELGVLARQIHTVDINPLTAISELLDRKEEWGKRMSTEFDEYFGYVKNSGLLPSTIITSIDKLSKEYESFPDMSHKYTLIHGDFSRDNLQVRDGHIVGIFDFEMAQIGDPLYDLQKLPIKFQLGIGFDRNAFLAGYSTVTMTHEEKVRLSRYAISQGLWEIWATGTKTFDYGEKEMEEAKELIINAL